jgi:hypothetical protein
MAGSDDGGTKQPYYLDLTAGCRGSCELYILLHFYLKIMTRENEGNLEPSSIKLPYMWFQNAERKILALSSSDIYTYGSLYM